MIKRIISFILSVLLILQVPIIAYADSPGVTQGANPSPYRPGNSNWNQAGSTWNDWGLRVTFAIADKYIQ